MTLPREQKKSPAPAFVVVKRLKKEYKRFTFSGRIRYQFSFDKLYETANYNAEFDQAIRLKPSVKYKIKKSKFTPLVSIEYFYNPKFEENGRQFVKYRITAGTEVDLNKKNNVTHQNTKQNHNKRNKPTNNKTQTRKTQNTAPNSRPQQKKVPQKSRLFKVDVWPRL